MKKVLLAAAMLLSMVQIASAQLKGAADSQKAIDSAKKAADDPKKAEKVATWLKLGEAYVKCWDNNLGGLWLGASETDLKLIYGSEKPLSQEMVMVSGEQMRKDSYKTVDVYFSSYGTVAMAVPTDLADENCLSLAADAYKKAYEVDAKHSKNGDIAAAFKGLNERLNNAGTAAYMLGDLKKASLEFEKAADVLALPPVEMVDTNAVTNAGLCAYQGGDNARALELYKKCLTLGIDDDEIYAKLADISKKLEDVAGQKSWLDKGISKYPDSQALIIGLINYSIDNNENPDQVFGYLHEAQKNDPTNASLWYVEGNVLSEVGRLDEAIERYHDAQKIDPTFVYGFIGEGLTYLKQADAIAEAADAEVSQRKYDALMVQYAEKLKATAPVFEKVVADSTDPGIKFGIAQYLKEIYFRLRDEGPEYKELHEKYKAIVDAGQQ